MRATVKQQYAESLYFLDAPLADATIAQDQRDHVIDGFLTGTADETEIQVRNVTLDDLKAAPYKAVVEFDKVVRRLRQPAGAEPGDLRRADHVRAPRPDSERGDSRQPAGADHHLFPRRSGVQMIANAAFLAAMVLLLLAFSRAGAAGVPGALQAPHRGPVPLGSILGALVIVFLNLFALFYLIARGLFLKDTGRKLAHRREAAPDGRHDRPRPVGAAGGGGLTPCREAPAPTVRADPPSRTPEPRPDRGPSTRAPRVPMDGLSLPRTETRERVTVDDRVYHLRGSEARTLATVGAFRLVPADQLDERRGDVLERRPPASGRPGPDRAQDDHRQPAADARWSC